MRTVTISVDITAVAEATESQIKEAVVAELRRQMHTPPNIGWCFTEERQSVRVIQVEAG